jgi:hypothetical protein
LVKKADLCLIPKSLIIQPKGKEMGGSQYLQIDDSAKEKTRVLATYLSVFAKLRWSRKKKESLFFPLTDDKNEA